MARNDPYSIGLETPYFSRPGSAYVVKSQPLYGKSRKFKTENDSKAELSDKQYLALNHGDVLNEAPGTDHLASTSSSAPRFSAWRT